MGGRRRDGPELGQDPCAGPRGRHPVQDEREIVHVPTFHREVLETDPPELVLAAHVTTSAFTTAVVSAVVFTDHPAPRIHQIGVSDQPTPRVKDGAVAERPIPAGVDQPDHPQPGLHR